MKKAKSESLTFDEIYNVAKRGDEVLESFWRKVEFVGRWKFSLTVSIGVVLLSIVARYYYSFVTGYIVPDEAYYYNVFILERQPISSSYRPIFGAIFSLFFHDVHSVWTFLFLGVAYSALWSIGCILIFFLTLRRLNLTENVSSLLTLSLPLFPVYTVLAPTILTETPSLFMALVAAYFSISYIQKGRAWEALLSGTFYVLASGIREPYIIFAAGNVLLFLALSIKRKSVTGFLAYTIPVLIVFPVPVQLKPRLEFQSIYAWVWHIIAQGIRSHMNPNALLPDISLSGFTVPISLTPKPDFLKSMVLGLGYGFNPLFAVFAIVSIIYACYQLLKERSPFALFAFLTGIWSLSAYVLAATFIVIGWTSTLIRASHVSLSSILTFPSLYHRLKARRVLGLMIILLIVGSTMLGSLAAAVQTSLSVVPVDRLSLDYRAPYYRLYLLAKDSGKTLVFGGREMRGISMYMGMLPNVVLVPVGSRQAPLLNQTHFQSLVNQNWDSIFLYDDWYTIAVPKMINASYPSFYAGILRTRQYPGFVIQTLWVDGESYALKMVKVSGVGVAPSSTAPPGSI